MNFRYIALFLIAWVLWCCKRNTDISTSSIMPAFYHWKSHLSTSDFQLLPDSANLYLRFFDIDWDGRQAVPKAVVQIDQIKNTDWKNIQEGRTITPVVFITNQTMLSIAQKDIPLLANRMIQKLEDIANRIPMYTVAHFQLDCDWTQNSKENYFALIEYISTQRPTWQLSATLRLHQYKYPSQTGVPPVTRVALMYYNMGELTAWHEPNSILNNQTAAKYLDVRGGYPLPVDLALPLFSWGVVFRDGKMVRLLPKLEKVTLANNPKFSKIASNKYRVDTSFYLNGVYLYKGDQIRWEAVDEAMLLEATTLLKPHMSDRYEVIYYHLDSVLIEQIGQTTIKTITAALK